MVDITTLDLLTSSSEPQNLTGLENLKQYCPEYEEEAQLIINVLQPFFSSSNASLKTSANVVFCIYKKRFPKIDYPKTLIDSAISKQQLEEKARKGKAITHVVATTSGNPKYPKLLFIFAASIVIAAYALFPSQKNSTSIHSLENRNPPISSPATANTDEKKTQPTKDPVEVFKKFEKAAENGDVALQEQVGCWYLFGTEGVEKNPQAAVEWFNRAAGQGNASAQYWLGLMYGAGRGVQLNFKNGFEWSLKAASQGHAPAQLSVGHFYEVGGEGVPQNDAEAVRWYIKAAEQGESDKGSEFRLGLSYYAGIDVDKNISEAKKWFNKAHEHGHPQAINMLEIIERDEAGLPISSRPKFSAQCPRCNTPWVLTRCDNCGGDEFYADVTAIKCKKCDYICVSIGRVPECLACGAIISFSKIQAR